MAAQSDHLAFLRSTPLFASVPEDTLARIAEIASEKSHGTGKVIVRQGGQAHAFHLGVVVATLGPRDHFGEIAVVKNAKRNATVTAISPARVLAIDTISFRRLVDSDAALADALPPAIAERLAERDEKLAD
jgi:CRP-like cAMP-binding protein